jgi:outer membrane immunogenic protein
MTTKLFSAAYFACGFFGICAASAADLPLKAPATAASAVFGWTGLYFGVHAGGDRQSEDWFFPSTALNTVSQAPVGAPFNVAAGGHSTSGTLVGGQIGYNHQFGNWVVGAEGEFSWTNLGGSHADPTFPNTNNSRTDLLATMGARFGYATDHLLLFGKAGGAWEHSNYFTTAATTFIVGDPGLPPSTIPAGSREDTATLNRFGLMIGIGAEYALSPNWSVKAEYEYLDFGRQRITLSPAEAGLAPFNEDIRQQLHLFTAGINYKLGQPSSPSLAAYAEVGRVDPGPRFYGGAEYLLWSLKGAPLSVPLVSSGPESNKEGFLVNSNTTILYGAPSLSCHGRQ